VTALIFVVSADNLASGIASAAFIAYLSGLTNVSYSATQYALFSSMMLLLPKFMAGFSGDYVNAFGYAISSVLAAWSGSTAQNAGPAGACFKTTTATSFSPHWASGSPSTAQSATSGWLASRCSISAG
jgi:hypothetical protein